MKYLAQRGLQLVVERADILDKLEREHGLYELAPATAPVAERTWGGFS